MAALKFPEAKGQVVWGVKDKELMFLWKNGKI